MTIDGKHEAVPIRGAAHEVVFDALNRTLRTWWAAVGAGLLTALGDLGLQLLISDDPLAGDFWRSLVRGLVMAVLTAVFTYLARFKAPPPRQLTVPATEQPVPAVVNVYPLPGAEGTSVVEAIRAAQKTDPPADGTVL